MAQMQLPSNLSKRQQLNELVCRRKEFDLNIPAFAGCRHLRDFHDGVYESDFVVPWTKSACNINADLMLVAQDWASAAFLERPVNACVVALGHDPGLETNKNLKIWLRDYLGLEFGQTYATDAFPFIKPGRMGARINRNAFDLCVEKFVLKQIEIIQPRIVVCLGKMTYDGICRVSGLTGASDISRAIEQPITYGCSKVVRVAHPGFWGRRSRGDKIEGDWKAIRHLIDTV